MKTKFIYTLSLLAMCAGCASTPQPDKSARRPASEAEGIADSNRQQFAAAGEENDDYPEDRVKTCDIQASSEMLMKGAANVFHSQHHSIEVIKNAYKNCNHLERLQGGEHGFLALATNHWYCVRGTNPHDAPPGALVFIGNSVEAHFKTDKQECFLMDFRLKDCGPISELNHRERKTYGWCTP